MGYLDKYNIDVRKYGWKYCIRKNSFTNKIWRYY